MTIVWVYLHLLATSILLGKVVLLSFVVAPVLAGTLEPESFGKVVRRLFPAYYLLGMMSAGVGLASIVGLETTHEFSLLVWAAIGLWGCVLVSEAYCRFSLTPRSNAMRDRLKQQETAGSVDAELQRAWGRLHRRSVQLNSVVMVAGLVLIGIANRLSR